MIFFFHDLFHCFFFNIFFFLSIVPPVCVLGGAAGFPGGLFPLGACPGHRRQLAPPGAIELGQPEVDALGYYLGLHLVLPLRVSCTSSLVPDAWCLEKKT